MNYSAVLIVDQEAVEIGDLYQQARASVADSVRCLVEAGHRLSAKKDSLPHGAWLPWLAANADALGFESRRTAARLIKAAEKCDVDDPFEPSQALRINREIWGNRDSQLIQQSRSAEHYTPTQYIAAATEVLGKIDLDPASCAEANRVVKAATYFDAEADGLKQAWRGRLWLNPPYGALPGPFIEKLCAEMASGNVEAAIVLVNAHCTDTLWFRPLWDGLLCFTDHRINFSGDDARSGSTHGSVFVYFGDGRKAFLEAFRQFGAVVARAQ